MLVGLAALAYLAPLAVRDYSWVFVSSDSGDWLAAASTWMVPQPYGAPLYILLARLLSLVSFGHLALVLTIGLSAIPTAITTAFVYKSANKLTGSVSIALAGAALTCGSIVLLSQSTVTEIMALPTMFLAIAFYYYLEDRRTLTVVALALGTAVHVVVAPIAVFWLLADRRFYIWLKPILLYVAIVLVSYSFILLLMYLPTPRYMAGGLSLEAVIAFWTKTSSAIIGQISVFETPNRLWFTLKLLLASFGVALIPLVYAFKRPLSRPVLVLLGTTVFVLWYFITCIDSMTWTYLAFMTPAVATLACIGLARVRGRHLQFVLVYMCLILILNPIFFNAHKLDRANPEGTDYIAELKSISQDAIVVADTGPESLGLMYYISSHDTDIVPLIYAYLDYPDFYIPDYADYIETTYHLGLDYSSTLAAIQSALAKNYTIYYVDYDDLSLRQCFNLVGSDNVKQIVGLTGLPPKPVVEMQR